MLVTIAEKQTSPQLGGPSHLSMFSKVEAEQDYGLT